MKCKAFTTVWIMYFLKSLNYMLFIFYKWSYKDW